MKLLTVEQERDLAERLFYNQDLAVSELAFGGDLLLIVFETLRAHDIEIPFPQREVRVINEDAISLKNTTP